MLCVHASATPSSPRRCWMKETRSSTPAAIRSCSICHSWRISPHNRRASSSAPASSASIALSIVGRESSPSSCSENQRSVMCPPCDERGLSGQFRRLQRLIAEPRRGQPLAVASQRRRFAFRQLDSPLLTKRELDEQALPL